MFRFKPKGAVMCRKIAEWSRREAADEHEPRLANAATIVYAIFLRERSGATTTLRQLHKITALSQTDALKAVSDLERAQMVLVDRDIHDALESELSLTRIMRAALEQAGDRNAA